MKKLFVALLLAIVSTSSAFAQFEKGKWHIGANFSSFDMSYRDGFNLGIGANGGYFVAKDWLVGGEFTINVKGGLESLTFGGNARYIFDKTGFFLQGNAKYAHFTGGLDEFQIGPEFGWTYFFNKYLAIEPSVYCDFSIPHFKQGTKVGVKIGLGWYF